MSSRRVLSIVVLTLALTMTGGAGITVSRAQAAENPIAVDKPGSILQALEQHLGERVKLKLVSGQDLEGKVAEVGKQVVIIDGLTGMEFYGATVRIDQIAAVIVRMQAK